TRNTATDATAPRIQRATCGTSHTRFVAPRGKRPWRERGRGRSRAPGSETQRWLGLRTQQPDKRKRPSRGADGPSRGRTSLITGLRPIESEDARLLVLGSIPSAESLRRQEYYGNPRNLFWRLLFAALETEDPGIYSRRLEALHSHRIALWDVLRACE